MKKAIVCLALAAAALSAPVLSFAQSNGPVTRAEVRSNLVQVERAGYNPARSDDASYPADIQAAEAKVAAQSTYRQATQGYGGVPTNSTSSGSPMETAMQSTCVGPVSFCTPYFGK
ncbi:DUF4148 domain-containing protein [Paraburkholderia phytofirmans]|uniref:Purine nucleoside phosphorylase n=1 Tax=Paraburkholderia phytofirmans (strain DSM 17436 / LMG 22146 / PsJN) TaxID=398527 RepID=B2T8G6_PARPJ|nr:DUF4148 domain-containing protein [Paraburkholderia phytofirmans]ACD20530.1 conserved hypothetical protein [Paraburkholderia phytofirmans PsJN]